ncbi:MAG: glycerol-3-phosphate 1-O-acyltransferase PlsY [Erythrobacter sp.]|nr:glycerol-3-phosphate 1-O-acyltransferase PlsY [Erythrobacter sp.]
MELLQAWFIGYLFGSIPFGLLLAWMAGKGDIRNIGSGNIGATNVLRTGSKWLAAATLLLDFWKGLVPVILAGTIWWTVSAFSQPLGMAPISLFGTELGRWGIPEAAAALGAVMGHCFPIWLKFKGGKGVATNAGVCFGLAWQIGLVYAFVWIAFLAIFRVSSVAGMSAVVAAALAAWWLGFPHFVPVLTVIAILVIWLHRENIKRLAAGTEPKVGSKG